MENFRALNAVQIQNVKSWQIYCQGDKIERVYILNDITNKEAAMCSCTTNCTCRYCLANNTYILDKKENRMMRLFVLSSGYVATFTNSLDEDYWGSTIIPLAFGSEISAQKAVDMMQSANPENLVSFAGGLQEYHAFTGRS
jgi:hypothetical protein